MNDLFIVSCYIITAIYFVSLSFLIFRKILLPNNIFTVLWCLCGVLSIFNNLGLIKPSIKVHIYIFISIFVFNFIYLISSKNKKNIYKRRDNIKSITSNINYELIKVLNIIALILISKHLISSLIVIINSGFDLKSVRDEVFVGLTNSNNFILIFLTRTIPSAIFNVTVLIATIDICFKEKKLLFWAIIDIIIYTLTFGGRFLILNGMLYYVAMNIIIGNKINIKINKKYIIIIVTILLGITLSRGQGEDSLVNAIIFYFVGSFSFFELTLRNPIQFGLAEPLKYGYLTLGFIFEPIVLFLKLVFGINIDVPSYYFNQYIQKFYNIGENSYILYNNNVTMHYTFLRDFGEFGIIVGTVLIVTIICILEKKYIKYNSIRSILMLTYMYTVIINSTIMYTMNGIGSSLIIIFIFICTRKGNIYEANN